MKTALTELWGLSVPIVGAPMSPQSGGRLAAAVSRAGALGLIGVSAAQSAAQVTADADECRRLAPDRPFGIGLMAWAVERRPELLDAAIAARPLAIAVSFGDPAPYAARIHAAGARLLCQVQDRASALAAEAAGADLIVAQGTEGGGHTGTVGTLPLLQIVLASVRTPVVAAGGIATGRGLAAVIAAGAEGAWIGTALLAAEEARNTSMAKTRILAARETDTVLTAAFDAVQSIPWPKAFRGRALRNEFTARWDGREDGIDEETRRAFEEARRREDYATAHLYAGQVVGLMDRVEPAGDIVRRIHLEAETRLRETARVLSE